MTSKKAKEKTPNVLPSIKAGNEVTKTVRIYFKRTLEINQRIPVTSHTLNHKKGRCFNLP